MPVDFQVAFPQELVQVSQVKPVPGLPVRTLDIYGEDFRAVEDVLMNQMSVPSFVVLSKSRLLAEVPTPLVHSTITSISVLSRKLSVSPRSYIRFNIGRTPSKTRGILKLMQLFLKVLLTTPGSDIFAPKAGGGALSHLGQSVGTNEGSDVVAGIIVSVDSAARQIIQVQGRNQSIPPDERLMSAKVLSAGFNKNETAILVGIELTSQAGRSAVARFEA
jgi:hypothetical protein